jgi:hypothetical protein
MIGRKVKAASPVTTAPSSGSCFKSSITSIISALSGGTTSEPTDA